MNDPQALTGQNGQLSNARPDDFGVGQLFWRIHEAVIAVDARGGIVLWNPAAERLFGYSAAEVFGRSVELIVPDALKPQHRAGITRYAESGCGPIVDRRLTIELPALHRSGIKLAVELSLAPLEHRSRPGRYVLAIIRDVTERRQAEEDRAAGFQERATRIEAEATRRRLALQAEASGLLGSTLDYQATLLAVARLAVPTLADGCVVYMTDDDCHVRSVAACHRDPPKERSLQLLGTRRALHPSEANPVVRTVRTGHSEFHATVSETLASALTNNVQQRILLQDAGPQSYICVPLAGRGQIAGAIELIRAHSAGIYGPADLVLAEDLAYRAGMAVENARLYQEARDAIRVRDEFLASASHELRTPVTTIKAFAQILRRRVINAEHLDGTELLEALESIDGNASRLAAQINELLDLSRLHAGRPIELYGRLTDLMPIVYRIAGAHQLLSGRHTIEIKTDLTELIGFWDGFRLERVLSNLLSNAVKYSPPGGEILVSVRAEHEDSGDTAVLTVRDQGIGIPEADLPHVFETFYRASNVPERAYGTGTGLAGVFEIIRLHGGTIGIESSAGVGTVCTVRLPCHGDLAGSARQDQSLTSVT